MIIRDEKGRFIKGNQFWLGKKRSKETVEKVRSALRGKHRPEDVRLKISHSMMGLNKGKPSPFKGKRLEEIVGPEKAEVIREKLRLSKLGDKNPTKRDDVKNKMKENSWVNNPNLREKVVEKIKRKLKGRRASPRTEFKKGHKIRLGKHHTKESKRKMSLAHRRENLSYETILKMKLRALGRNFPKKQTLIEQIMDTELTKHGIPHKNNVLVDDVCIPDHIIIIGHKKIAIFDDGDYWHANPKLYKDKLTSAQRKNVRRDKYNSLRLREKGWTVFRFWESDIKKDVTSCVNKILENIIEVH